MPYRNKTYVAFDADNDIRYYNLMKAWKQNDNTTFNFYDAHDLNNLREDSNEATIKRKLKERMDNSKVFVLLIGNHTKYLYKYVRWEIEIAIGLDLPIICVNLDGGRKVDFIKTPKIIIGNLSIHISFGAKILEFALENWPNNHYEYRRLQTFDNYEYIDDVYSLLNI